MTDALFLAARADIQPLVVLQLFGIDVVQLEHIVVAIQAQPRVALFHQLEVQFPEGLELRLRGVLDPGPQERWCRDLASRPARWN